MAAAMVLFSHETGARPLTQSPIMQTRFVLINTSHAGNVGAAARAMKVMGFDDMVLVAPRWANVLRREETLQRASGALDVLAKARTVPTLPAWLVLIRTNRVCMMGDCVSGRALVSWENNALAAAIARSPHVLAT